MDDQQLARLLEENLPALRAFVRLRTSQRLRAFESSSDLVQSVCRELIDGRERIEYQSDEAFRGWLFTAALRKIVEHDRYLRAQKRDVRREVRPAARTDEGGRDDGLLAAYATITTPSVVASAREQMELLETAFEQLPEDQREVISLNKIAGLSHVEIAEQTGRSPAHCRQLLHRAKIRLSVVLQRLSTTE